MRTGRYRERIESELSFLDTVAKDLGRNLRFKWEDEVRKGVLSDAYCLKELSKRYDPGSGFCLICDYDKSMELLDLAIESWKVEPKDVEISDLLEMKSYYYQLRGEFALMI